MEQLDFYQNISLRISHIQGKGWGRNNFKEEVENCLRRELFEEIGVIAKRYSFFDSYDFKYPTKIYNLHFYLVHHYDGEITMNVHDKIEWVSFNELKNYKLLPGDIPLLEKLYKKHKE